MADRLWRRQFPIWTGSSDSSEEVPVISASPSASLPSLPVEGELLQRRARTVVRPRRLRRRCPASERLVVVAAAAY